MSEATAPLSPAEEAALNNTDLSKLIGDDSGALVSAADITKADAKKGKKVAKPKKAEQERVVPNDIDDIVGPGMGSDEWPDFVMRKFAEHELDPQGRPTVRGLRRVARLLLGRTISSRANVVQCPDFMPHTTLMRPAVVAYEVTIAWSRPEDLADGEGSFEATFGGVGEAHARNTEPDFARFAASVAETRAEGRALRKALGIDRMAAEESTVVPVVQSIDGKVTKEEVDWLDLMAQRWNLNVMAILNRNKAGVVYETIWDLESEKASKLSEFMTGIGNDQSKIKPEYRGYKSSWKERK